MSATKFEKARIRFKSDIFAAVAVVRLKLPNIRIGTLIGMGAIN